MRMLAHDALVHSLRVFGLVQKAAAHSRSGDHAKARAALDRADAIVVAELPVLKGVIAAQTQAAEGLNLKEWTLWGQLPCRGQPQEHLHAANDHVAPPEQPTPTVA